MVKSDDNLTSTVFFPWKWKVHVKAIFCWFLDFFHGQKMFLGLIFTKFCVFCGCFLFTATFFFTNTYFFYFSRWEKIGLTGINNKTKYVFNFTEKKIDFFYGHRFWFHGCNFSKISQANFNFHGNFFGDSGHFSVYSVFLHCMFFFFHGKKHCPTVTQNG